MSDMPLEASRPEEFVDLVFCFTQKSSLYPRRRRLPALEQLREQCVETRDYAPDPKLDQTQCRPIVKQHDQNHPPRDVSEIQRFLLSLMKQSAELRLPEQPCQLVVGTEVRGGQRGECDRVERRLMPHR